MLNRRAFAAAGLAAAGATALTAAQAKAALGEPERFPDPATRDPLPRKQLGGRTGFVTLNG
ncbi:MAG TPA: hypothetical protein VF606_11200, partial [Geminicoccaceae bacterium]